ncbi:MAG: type VI secretion system tip protein VgrG [Aquabacterium sp.]|nr:MAG: type VI secretion system tip protein VgrG [Aquabacterium sp.]
MSSSLLEHARERVTAVASGLASRLDFPALLGQDSRLLQIETALPSTALLVERLRGREAVDAPFHFELDCLATSAHLELKRLVGEQVSVRLLRADGGWRVWHGYVTSAAQLGGDGALARFGLRLESWLAFLALRRDSHVFQGRHALQVVEEVFRDHPQANWRVAADPGRIAALRVRETCTQFDETDLDFVRRLLAEEGLGFHFEHEDDGKPLSEARAARHRLVITDADCARPQLGRLRYTRPDLRGASAGGFVDDGLTAFAAARRLRPTAVTLGRWSPDRLGGVTGQRQATAHEQLPALEIYDSASDARPGLQGRHTEAHAQLLLDALRLDAHRYEGRGAVRTLAAGSRFTLDGHPTLSGASFTVLAVEHEAENNLPGQASPLRGLGGREDTSLDKAGDERGGYRQRLLAVPAQTPIVPLPRPRPSPVGTQLARVVGVAGQVLHTDRDLRVKIQYPWQRGRAPLPGGSRATGSATDPHGNAPGDDSAGFWVRVAQPSAGNDWGSVFVPRVGAEVLVAFADGDIDAPLIAGQLHTPDDPPPWPAGAHTGTNHPGVISGLRSGWLDGGGHNEWLMDDSGGQLRMRLRAQGSGIAAGELSLGHLVQQATSADRGNWLGSGFYAQTDGWAVVRAERGLLLSTATRPANGTSVESTQMDAAEAVAQLKAAHDLGRRLSDTAQAQGAQKLGSHDPQQALARHIAAIDPQQDGRLGDAAGGQHALEPRADGRTAGEAPVEAFAEPRLHLDAAGAQAWSSDGPIASYSAQDFSLVAQADLHHAAAHTWAAVSGGGSSLYTHAGGLRAIAANGPVSLRAHTGRQELLAEQGISVTSSSGEIVVQAAQRIELAAGGCQVVLDGGDITFKAPGAFRVKAASHDWAGSGGQAARLPALPAGLATQPSRVLELNFRYQDMQPVVGADYQVHFEDGSWRSGKLDDQGHAVIENTPGPGRAYFGYDTRDARPRQERPANALHGRSAATPEEAASLLERYLQAEQAHFTDNYFDDEMPPDGDVDFEDLVDDYDYRQELQPPAEPGGPPGEHPEHHDEDTPAQGQAA